MQLTAVTQSGAWPQAAHVALQDCIGHEKFAAQSKAHVVGDSFAPHFMSPQVEGMPQSFGHVCEVSPLSHTPLPQLPTHRFCWTVQLDNSHAEIEHKSPVVQVVPLASAVTVQPLRGSQPSLVQTLPSSHLAGLP